MDEKIIELAPVILAEVQKAKKILLHLHPRPDGDSVGSALGMMHVLEGMGKEVSVIKGDSPLPEYLSGLPGFEKILPQNFFETDLTQFDLFIIQDSSIPSFISSLGEIKFPESLKTIVIDHHVSTVGYGQINLLVPSYPAVCQILFDVFKAWGVQLTHDSALCLYLGMNTDTGGFSYENTLPSTFKAVAELTALAPDFSKIISEMHNSNTVGVLEYEALALSTMKSYLNNRIAISAVSYDDLQRKNIPSNEVRAADIANKLKSVKGWEIGVGAVEEAPNQVKVSFRTRDSEKYNLVDVASALGGGGHRAAAATIIKAPLNEAVDKIVAAIAQLWNL